MKYLLALLLTLMTGCVTTTPTCEQVMDQFVKEAAQPVSHSIYGGLFMIYYYPDVETIKVLGFTDLDRSLLAEDKEFHTCMVGNESRLYIIDELDVNNEGTNF